MHAGSFWYFHHPLNMDYRTFNVRMWSFCIRTHTENLVLQSDQEISFHTFSIQLTTENLARKRSPTNSRSNSPRKILSSKFSIHLTTKIRKFLSTKFSIHLASKIRQALSTKFTNPFTTKTRNILFNKIQHQPPHKDYEKRKSTEFSIHLIT